MVKYLQRLHRGPYTMPSYLFREDTVARNLDDNNLPSAQHLCLSQT